ncbi:MAG TPA: class I tRNA ligase family protein, partial [Verrucomicrobiae bacterium]|nr:class I tRNA ligase family protein [Verrucomicrobiae bacterium]
KKVSDMSNILDKKWLHIGLLNNNSEKMSNSVGNTIIISNFLKKYNPNTLKLYFLSESYKNDINFSYADLDRFDKIDKDITLYLLSSNENSKKIVNLENTLIKKFLNFLYVDYDTKSAISFILDLLNDISNSFVVVWMLKILGLEYY